MTCAKSLLVRGGRLDISTHRTCGNYGPAHQQKNSLKDTLGGSVQHNILFMCTPFTQRRMRHRSTGSSDMFLSFNFILTTTGRSRCWTDISDIHDISDNTGTGRSSKSSCVSINNSTGRSTWTDCKSDTVHGWTDRSPDTGTGDRL